MDKPTISIIVPGLNEEGNINDTIDMIISSLDEMQKFNEYEIIIIDDGSRDKTGQIADEYAGKYPFIKVVHHTDPMGLGYAYRRGVKEATKEYVGWVPGKNSIPKETFIRMMDAVGSADIVLVYILSEVRGYFRRYLSKLFTLVLNILFGLHLRYFNGPCIYKNEILRKTKMTTNGFAFMAEINIRSVRAGYSYIEVGLNNQGRTHGNSKAFVFRNFLRVCNLVTKLFWEIQVKNRIQSLKNRTSANTENVPAAKEETLR
jgi:glycosyltransferase involved in cell wall biosynthesis